MDIYHIGLDVYLLKTAAALLIIAAVAKLVQHYSI